MSAILFYLSAILVFFFIYNILTWGLNIQFGYTGILNFAFIVFMAIGAYIYGVTSLAPPDPSVGKSTSWGFPGHFRLPSWQAGLQRPCLGC